MQAVLWTVLAVAATQAPKKPDPDQVRVDQAIRKGIDFLRTAPSPGQGKGGRNADDLILLTFIHAGVAENDPKFQELLAAVLAAPLETTYKVSLQAMALEELERVKFQERIFHCAQFLVDNQAATGQWGYGEPTTLPDFPAGTPTAGAKKPVAKPTTTKKKGVVEVVRQKPPVVQKVAVKKQRDGSEHDNSNSQYAALGLRACHDAGILLPAEVVERAAEHWRRAQEGGASAKGEGRNVATGGGTGADARGWGYDKPSAYGSMTAGGVGALAIYDAILGADWRKDANVQSGLSWLAENFTVAENPRAGGEQQKWHFYYLYALERVGMLCDTETIGRHAWYPVGMKYLLDAQAADGSWRGSDKLNPTWETCFAILFLKRSTRSLRDVASIDRFHTPKER